MLTNKHGPSSRRICEHLGIAPLLQGVFGAQDTPWLKPDPQFTAYALATLRADAATACLVGDSPFDAETARRGGIHGFFVTTGTHSAEQLRASGAHNTYPDLAALARTAFALPLDVDGPDEPGA